MRSEHKALLEELRAASRPAGGFDLQAYAGTTSPMLNVRVPDRRRIARAWLKAHRHWSTAQVLALVDDLVAGETHDEKTLGLLLLEGRGRRPFGPAEVDRWLDRLVGWAEVDSLCQSTFGPEDLLGDWEAWCGFIRRLSKDPNINKRRASLVLLCRSTRASPDPRLLQLGLEIVEALKGQREILITKAVSWVLRTMGEQHPAEITAYLEANAATLPAIAVRETRIKLTTGRKTPARRA